MKNLIALHCDTCLPSFWSGHHLPHIQVMVRNGDSLGELKANLISELNQGCVMGSDAPAEDDSEWFNAARRAIEKIEVKDPAPNPDDTRMFLDLEEVDETDDCSESVYAYFVFEEGEELVDMTDAEYVAVQGLECPYCRSRTGIQGHDVNIDNGQAFQSVTCTDCDEAWVDTYQLTGYSKEEE